MSVDEIALQEAVKTLKSGGTILYPTDTIWGIGCDATNKKAVEKIFFVKKRNESKSLIVLLDRPENLNKYILDVPALAWDLIEFTEKPLTIIYPKARGFAPNVLAEDGSIGIRITKDDFCRKLIQRLGKPIVSTSANISGEPSPASFSEISSAILNGVDYVVHSHSEKRNTQASAIIQLGLHGEIKILRK
ncbi:MAG: L-threonylcarbamoyladenylate synthase [Bacteroidia bacterium]